MTMRLLAALASGALLLAGSGAQAQAGDTGANWDAVVQCARLSGATARHDCIDQLLRDKGVLDSQRELSDARQSFGQDRRVETRAAPVAAHAPVIAPSVTAAAPPPPRPSAPPELKALQTQIASVRVGANRMLVITTAEGAVWRQTQTTEIRTLPVKGDAIEIEQGALGGHRCKIGSKMFRCQRVG
jgi:hypothetical protein